MTGMTFKITDKNIVFFKNTNNDKNKNNKKKYNFLISRRIFHVLFVQGTFST